MPPPPRAHTSLGFTPKTSKKESAGGVLGHSAQPAASFGFEARKANLDPRRKQDFMTPERQRGAGSSAISSLPTFKLRQHEREERSKQRYRMPDAAAKISAEKLILSNPLLDESLTSTYQEYKVKSLTSLSLTDLCMLQVAFEKADIDHSGELDNDEFVAAFLPLLAADAGDVSLLFMRIDANCDGTVSWEEFLTYILSQDEGALQIETESSRQLFDYPAYTDSTGQLQGHRDIAGGLLVLAEADRYVSFSRKGELLVWKPDGIEGVKVQHPKEFQTDLPFITGLVHAKRMTHSDRLCLCSADKRLIFVDLMRDNCKLSGSIKLDISPLCMCVVAITDDNGDEKERMLAFGDDAGHVHLYNLTSLFVAAERNLMNVNSRKAQEGHIKSWLAHEKHAWLSKVAYISELRVLISCGSDAQVVLSDVTKGEVKVDGLKHRGEVHDFVWLPRVQLLASCGVERHINLWQLPIKVPVYQLDAHQASVQQLVFGAGQMFSLDTSKTLIVWDLREMGPIQRLEGLKVHQEYPIGRMGYDSKRTSLITLSRKMVLWHMNQKKVPNGHTSPVTSCVYNPTFELVVSADDSSVVRVWDLNSGKAIYRFTDAHTNAKGEGVKISSMIFDKSWRRLVTGAHDGSVKIWNFSTGQCLRDLTGFGDGEVTSVTQMHVTPYDYILACGWNRKVSFWMDLHDHGPVSAATDSKVEACQHFEGHKDDILCMACHNDTNTLITGSYDGDMIMWSAESGHMRSRLILPGILAMKGDQRPIESVGLLDCGSRQVVTEGGRQVKESVVLVVSVGGDGVVRMWSSDASAELLLEMPLTPPDVGLVVLACHVGNKVLVIGDAGGFIYVLDLQRCLASSIKAVHPSSQPLKSPVQVAHFRAHATAVSSLQYIAERRAIVTASQDCTICMWALEGEKLGTFGEPKEWNMQSDARRFEKRMNEAAFSEEFVNSMRTDTDEDNPKAQKKGRRAKQKGRPRLSMTSSSAPQIAALTESATLAEAADAPKMESQDKGASFFITQDGTEEAAPAPCDAGSKSQSADQPASVQSVSAFMAENELGSDDYESSNSSDYDSEESDGGQAGELEEDKAVEMTDEEKRAVMLKVDIDEIVQRGVAMKDRGEKFFETGLREVSAYQKMIVRELNTYSMPDSIKDSLAKRGLREKQRKAAAGAGDKKVAGPAGNFDEAVD